VREISSARFTTDGQFIVTIGKTGDQDTQVTKIWDAANGHLRASLAGYAVYVGSRASDLFPTVITVNDRELKVWNGSRGELTKTVSAFTRVHSDWRFYLDSVISPDGERIVTSRGKSMALWNTDTGGVVAYLRAAEDRNLFRLYGGRTLEIYEARFAPDSRTIATIDSYNRIEIWDATTGQLRSTLNGHLDSIYNIEFSDDGRLIGSASRDGTARVWDVSTGQLKHNLRAENQVSRRISESDEALES
jgi:WD40 repeat protein